MKKHIGRGQLKIIEKTPKVEEEEKQGRCPRNRWYFKAVDNLKQARRCEQAAYRIGIKDKEGNRSNQEEHRCLNGVAYETIAKHIDVHGQEERNFKNNLQDNFAGKDFNTMQIPMLKRQAERYHQKHDTMRRKAIAEDEAVKQQIIRAKGGGQWKLSKALDEKDANPLTALTRMERGPKGQPKGTVTTSPQEIDGIIRKVYGKIYKGNVSNHEENAKEYFRQYGTKGMHVIYKAEESPMGKNHRRRSGGDFARYKRDRSGP